MPETLAYDVVVPTRNRAGILRLSIPSFINQTRPPERIIVVDSSDDPGVVESDLGHVLSDMSPTPKLELVRSGPGLPHQRSEGAKRSSSPIILFPDDDSIYYPTVAESLMKVYEADSEGRIGAIQAGEALLAPTGSSLKELESETSSPLKRLAYHLGGFRADLENFLAPNPIRQLGEELTQSRLREFGSFDWLAGFGAKLDRNLQGFRMSMRREAFQECKASSLFSGYAIYEDEACALEILQSRVIVEVPGAPIYHHKAAGGRFVKAKAGFFMVLNQAYIVLMFSAVGSTVRANLIRSLSTRIQGYLVRNRFDRTTPRILGMNQALLLVKDALGVDPSQVPEWYKVAALKEPLDD